MQIVSKIRPNTARMWDFVMGGTHNFAVDRAAVRLARKLYPLYEESMREQRHFLQRAVTYMAREKGLDRFLDFGSGLPTRGNVHEIVCAFNPKARVIYSDKDSLTAAMGKEILGNTPNVCYVHCALEESCTLMDSPAVANMFGTDRRIGVSMIGTFLYVPDEPLARFFTTLHEWVDKGSHIAVTCARKKVKEVKGVEKAARRMGLKFYSRSAEETLKLIEPWELTEHGLVPGFYWGLPENAPEINAEIQEHSHSFVACK